VNAPETATVIGQDEIGDSPAGRRFRATFNLNMAAMRVVNRASLLDLTPKRFAGLRDALRQLDAAVTGLSDVYLATMTDAERRGDLPG